MIFVNTEYNKRNQEIKQYRRKMCLESVSLSIISREPTNLTATTSTLIDICAYSEPKANILFSQIPVPEMNTEQDLIYGAYKVSGLNATREDFLSWF
jgi:hypothetical protein